MSEDKTKNYAIDRARFQKQWCEVCNNVGIVRVQIDQHIGTLARCDCRQGDALSWALPKIGSLEGLRHQPLPENIFHPGVRPKSQVDGFKFIGEKLAYWREKLNIAEQFWKHNPKG